MATMASLDVHRELLRRCTQRPRHQAGWWELKFVNGCSFNQFLHLSRWIERSAEHLLLQVD